jgi:hypothetical protein
MDGRRLASSTGIQDKGEPMSGRLDCSRWSGRRDSNPRPSAPKAGQTFYLNLLKFVASKCFEMWTGRVSICGLLIHVDRLCFDRYKIDYIQPSPVYCRRTR